ncbi:MAG TPA: N-6 DNA methylase [Elusimicrobiota bacterium]|nr:N-6 DNA methylase [Elusimicrobiota bacterium]
MATGIPGQASERRAEHLLNDLLVSQGWDLRQPPKGDLLFQNEYRGFADLTDALSRASKTGDGHGIPEALLVDRATAIPLAAIETKRSVNDANKAIVEAQGYADALGFGGAYPLAIGLAGTSDLEFKLQVSKRVGTNWEPITYDGEPIGWIPTRADLERISIPRGPREIRPTIPPLEVLAARADEINRLLRESRIQDGQRPAVVGAIMLALWQSKGNIRRDPAAILRDINAECKQAFISAGKPDLARSLRIEEENHKLRDKVRRIVTILERLNVTVLTAEHDYLGQLYETFFRYTGGNTIGQYFTPRHITHMMVDLCEVTKDDVVLDPACGTGGFLIACMERITLKQKVSREQMMKNVPTHLIGFEEEPITAALCVANMILRGDGKTGVHRDDCFTADAFPDARASVALMNPPFPHEKTDRPSEAFVDRALEGLKDRGRLAVILPASVLVKKSKGKWRQKLLEKNSLIGVCQLPDELFQPFAAATTAVVLVEKGIPHNKNRKSMFVRLHHDGLTLRKGTRVERPSEPNQIPEALDAILNNTRRPGFSGAAHVGKSDEWAPGAYIESAPADEKEIKESVDVLLRRLTSFYTRYAPEIVTQRRVIEQGDVTMKTYREMVTKKRIDNAAAMSTTPGTIGALFDIYYGMKELHSREGFVPGQSLVISPTEEYNGCYGWLEFPFVAKAPFVTVAQTGSIGEAFVQMEPCAVNDDCLILLPKSDDFKMSDLVLAAACLRSEKWRFTYGRKLTPTRIADFRVPRSTSLEKWVDAKLRDSKSVIAASLTPYQRG